MFSVGEFHFTGNDVNNWTVEEFNLNKRIRSKLLKKWERDSEDAARKARVNKR